MVTPSCPEHRIVRFDHVDQCHIGGRAHEASDPVHAAVVENIIWRTFPHQIQPDMESSPVVNRCCAELRGHVGIFPYAPAPGAAQGFVLPLADKREAFPPLGTYQLLDWIQFADLAAPAGIDSWRPKLVEIFPEPVLPGRNEKLDLVAI